eukprot:1157619-Pelagomonas_calceolata.AAC.33
MSDFAGGTGEVCWWRDPSRRMWAQKKGSLIACPCCERYPQLGPELWPNAMLLSKLKWDESVAWLQLSTLKRLLTRICPFNNGNNVTRAAPNALVEEKRVSLTCNLGGTIEEIEPMESQLFGWPALEMKGRHIADMLKILPLIYAGLASVGCQIP